MNEADIESMRRPNPRIHRGKAGQTGAPHTPTRIEDDQDHHRCAGLTKPVDPGRHVGSVAWSKGPTGCCGCRSTQAIIIAATSPTLSLTPGAWESLTCPVLVALAARASFRRRARNGWPVRRQLTPRPWRG